MPARRKTKAERDKQKMMEAVRDSAPAMDAIHALLESGTSWTGAASTLDFYMPPKGSSLRPRFTNLLYLLQYHAVPAGASREELASYLGFVRRCDLPQEEKDRLIKQLEG